MRWIALRAIAAVTCAVSMAVSGPVSAQDLSALDKGFSAYDSGNYAGALEHFRIAAERGDAAAQSSLGLMYDNGEGVPENDAEAAKWYRLAAAQGYAIAQNNLGLLYANGDGVSQDFVLAYKWYNLAALQGNATALTNIEILKEMMTPQQIAEAGGASQAHASMLSLDLVCGGQYAATETSTADVGPIGTINSASITTNVMRPGSARVTLRGDIGELIYPDGRQRILSNVIADTANIKAEYVRRTLNYLFIPVTWRLEIDRMTGNIRIGSSAGELGFLGVCEAAPTVAKF